MTTELRRLDTLAIVTAHSNYGGYFIVKNDEGLFFVGEPYLNHRGELRRRNVGGWAAHREAREYCQQNAMKWMALHDASDNA